MMRAEARASKQLKSLVVTVPIINAESACAAAAVQDGERGAVPAARGPAAGEDAGEPSYALWKCETDEIHAALAHCTRVMAAHLNALPGESSLGDQCFHILVAWIAR
ncbi:hypothetical protein B0H21DRAFT_737139 [Amylocystis lapponica]|nr:hypothetical protein B0H21DRAFT_737139 [Amylocystis lapponica]